MIIFLWNLTDQMVKLDWSKIAEKEFMLNFKQAQACEYV